MPPQTHRKAQITQASPPSQSHLLESTNTEINTNRPQTQGNTGNFRYQNALFSLTAEWVDGTVVRGHQQPEPLPPVTEQPTIQRRAATSKPKGAKPPTKATEARTCKQQEKNWQQCLAHNKHEALAADLTFNDGPNGDPAHQ